ncbi:hotdog family protein [Mangrovicoccus ximenensis]|uniref:hypothetical protein n=1 Tax=Mangrovicoccus ximenensis TaxID=1911570 RepID=UPI0011AE5514|nr:hypothetical protein [Mangrovicoccus ximenensis]
MAVSIASCTFRHSRLRVAPAARAAGGPATGLLRHAPVPALDFNAAGLLYFPTFSKLAEMADPSRGPGLTRDIAYLANLDPGETVTAGKADGLLLLAAADRTPLAAIRTAGH